VSLGISPPELPPHPGSSEIVGRRRAVSDRAARSPGRGPSDRAGTPWPGRPGCKGRPPRTLSAGHGAAISAIRRGRGARIWRPGMRGQHDRRASAQRPESVHSKLAAGSGSKGVGREEEQLGPQARRCQCRQSPPGRPVGQLPSRRPALRSSRTRSDRLPRPGGLDSWGSKRTDRAL